MWTQYASFGQWKFLMKIRSLKETQMKKLEICGERSSVTFYKHKKAQLHRSTVAGRKLRCSYEKRRVRKQRGKTAQRLSSKHKFFIKCTVNTENKKKNLSRHNVENCLYLLITIMDYYYLSRRADSKQAYEIIRERTLLELSPSRYLNFYNEKFCRANHGKLARDNFDIPGNLLFEY